MLVKILGVFDLIAAFVIFALSFGLGFPRWLMIFLIVILLLKGAFILTGSIASVFDLVAALILILTFFFTIPNPILFIVGILLLQKAFFSVVA